MDQGKAVINFLDSILDKSLRSTVALLVACGYGKSTALGLAIVGSIVVGLPHAFVKPLKNFEHVLQALLNRIDFD
ncbi:hypothetical protein GUJ93_ZPchr0012g21457 [Zizania palustris]|uniref:Uncharacterized protein n=1 Tax=Zizania palustris TaxID=103762 RepID=A0A8J5WU05_ZIZPA|nr:hypothetical protein GUJ93_ZPchr0012g21457 [Zizania palustris]